MNSTAQKWGITEEEADGVLTGFYGEDLDVAIDLLESMEVDPCVTPEYAEVVHFAKLVGAV